jgi:dihydrofolate reductase/thymidylate synthase
MFDVIISMTKDGGIGYKGDIPWNCEEETAIFREKTKDSILIVGRKTVESFPDLPERSIIVLSSKKTTQDFGAGVYYVFDSIPNILKMFKHFNKDIFVVGGGQIYDEVFKNWRSNIKKLYMNVMKGEFKCDTFVNFDPKMWIVDKKYEYDEFTQYELLPIVSEESKYLILLKDVYDNGCIRNGRNGNTKSMFGKTMEFDLREGYPLLTTKKMFFRGVVEELLFFIRGNTDSKILTDNKINIWNGNTNRTFLDSIGKKSRREGVMGPMYGYQWRNYNAEYNEEKAGPNEKGLDQLAMVIDQIKNDPNSRRILMTDFNPLQARDGVLYPCHSIIIQFYVSNGFLDIFCYNRSSDLFHGLPFNIASTALLHILIAKITGLTARKFVLSLGDAHIYESHYDVVVEQLQRIPFKFTTVETSKKIMTLEDIENLEYTDFKLVNYNSYPTIKAAMVS